MRELFFIFILYYILGQFHSVESKPVNYHTHRLQDLILPDYKPDCRMFYVCVETQFSLKINLDGSVYIPQNENCETDRKLIFQCILPDFYQQIDTNNEFDLVDKYFSKKSQSRMGSDLDQTNVKIQNRVDVGLHENQENVELKTESTEVENSADDLKLSSTASPEIPNVNEEVTLETETPTRITYELPKSVILEEKSEELSALMTESEVETKISFTPKPEETEEITNIGIAGQSVPESSRQDETEFTIVSVEDTTLQKKLEPSEQSDTERPIQSEPETAEQSKKGIISNSETDETTQSEVKGSIKSEEETYIIESGKISSPVREIDSSVKIETEASSQSENDATPKSNIEPNIQIEIDIPSQSKTNSLIQSETELSIKSDKEGNEAPSQSESEATPQSSIEPTIQIEIDTPPQTRTDAIIQSETDLSIKSDEESKLQIEADTTPLSSIEYTIQGKTEAIIEGDKLSNEQSDILTSTELEKVSVIQTKVSTIADVTESIIDIKTESDEIQATTESIEGFRSTTEETILVSGISTTQKQSETILISEEETDFTKMLTLPVKESTKEAIISTDVETTEYFEAELTNNWNTEPIRKIETLSPIQSETDTILKKETNVYSETDATSQNSFVSTIQSDIDAKPQMSRVQGEISTSATEKIEQIIDNIIISTQSEKEVEIESETITLQSETHKTGGSEEKIASKEFPIQDGTDAITSAQSETELTESFTPEKKHFTTKSENNAIIEPNTSTTDQSETELTGGSTSEEKEFTKQSEIDTTIEPSTITLLEGSSMETKILETLGSKTETTLQSEIELTGESLSEERGSTLQSQSDATIETNTETTIIQSEVHEIASENSESAIENETKMTDTPEIDPTIPESKTTEIFVKTESETEETEQRTEKDSETESTEKDGNTELSVATTESLIKFVMTETNTPIAESETTEELAVKVTELTDDEIEQSSAGVDFISKYSSTIVDSEVEKANKITISTTHTAIVEDEDKEVFKVDFTTEKSTDVPLEIITTTEKMATLIICATEKIIEAPIEISTKIMDFTMSQTLVPFLKEEQDKHQSEKIKKEQENNERKEERNERKDEKSNRKDERNERKDEKNEQKEDKKERKEQQKEDRKRWNQMRDSIAASDEHEEREIRRRPLKDFEIEMIGRAVQQEKLDTERDIALRAGHEYVREREERYQQEKRRQN